jgi:hypothetical protein
MRFLSMVFLDMATVVKDFAREVAPRASAGF